MTLSKRDAHLKEFFPEELFKQLDEAEKTALYEEFANSELRILSSQPIETIHNRLSSYLQAENHRRLTHIQPEEYEVLKPWYKEKAKTLDEIFCSKCGALLGIEIDTIDDNINPSHHEGKFVVPIGELLLAYRPRLDGVMGYQCGNIVETKYKPEWDKFETAQAKAEAEYAEAQAEYSKASEAYEKLHWKKQNKKNLPKLKEVEFPTPPEGPAFEECGNDTRWAKIEEDNIPELHVMTSITKEDRIKVKQEMDATNYAPKVKKTKRGKTIESFELRKVK